jgi:hypothetical protein
MATTTRPRAPLACLAALLAACGADPAPAPTGFQRYVPAAGTPEAVAYRAGITRYLATAAPTDTEVNPSGVTTYTFDPADGPVCMRGGEFRASVREGASDDLLIFLQGGGACWSDFCLAVTAAPAGIPSMDLLRTTPEGPLRDFDVLYLPYCDGSLFAGDRAIDENNDGTPDRIHHGLQNLSAALTVGHRRFPRPRRVVLAGSSGGGFGTILAAFLVRYVYPGVPLYVINDSGVGVARSGDAAFLDRLIDEFGARGFIPADCADCTRGGHITGLVRYLLDHDPNVRVAALSSWYDFVIADLFLRTPPAAFRDALAAETGALHAAHPARYRRFLYDGSGHTALLGNATGIVGTNLRAVELPAGFAAQIGMVEIKSMYTLSVNDLTVARWIAAMVADDATVWADVVQPAGPAPMRATPAP